MKTTTNIVDDDLEYQYLRERGIINAEKMHYQDLLLKEMFGSTEVVLGRVRRRRKFRKNARITRKTSRIISNFQSYNRKF